MPTWLLVALVAVALLVAGYLIPLTALVAVGWIGLVVAGVLLVVDLFNSKSRSRGL